jgi:hypothetical protein
MYCRISFTWLNTNLIRIYEWKIVRKMYGFIKVGKHWRIRKNEEIKDIP